MSRRRTAVAAGVLLCLTVVAPVDAGREQSTPPGQATTAPRGRAGRPGGAARGAMTPAEVERMWDTYMATQARGALSLSDEQAPAFATRLQNLQNLRRRLQRQHNALRAELNRLAAGEGALDEAVVTAKLAEFDDFELQSARQVRRAYAAIDALLSPRQRVRFRVFEERMAQRKLDLLAEARRAARGGGLPQGPAL